MKRIMLGLSAIALLSFTTINTDEVRVEIAEETCFDCYQECADAATIHRQQTGGDFEDEADYYENCTGQFCDPQQ